MAAIRMNPDRRGIVLTYMMKVWEAKHPHDDLPLRAFMGALRAYADEVWRRPEHLPVLGRYGYLREVDRIDKTGGYCSQYIWLRELRLPNGDDTIIAGIRGPTHGMPVSQELYDTARSIKKGVDQWREDRMSASRRYQRWMIEEAKTLAKVEAVIPLPPEVRAALGDSPNLPAVLPQGASIKAEFSS